MQLLFPLVAVVLFFWQQRELVLVDFSCAGVSGLFSLQVFPHGQPFDPVQLEGDASCWFVSIFASSFESRFLSAFLVSSLESLSDASLLCSGFLSSFLFCCTCWCCCVAASFLDGCCSGDLLCSGFLFSLLDCDAGAAGDGFGSSWRILYISG